jgi:hypothetical protein
MPPMRKPAVKVVVFQWPCGCPASFAARSPAVKTHHLRCCSGLVDEDELFWIKVELPFEPGFASPLYILSALLGGAGNLFLSVIPWRWKNRQSVPIPAFLPRSFSLARSSASVRSGRSAIAPRMKAASASICCDLPPCFIGATARPKRTCAAQRMALDARTPNRTAA